MAKVGVDIVGNSAPLEAALGAAAGATEKFAVEYKAQFAGMSTATLQLAAAQDKLALATDRYGAGSLGAATATMRYRKEVDALAASQLAAASTIGRTLTTHVTLPLAALGFEAAKMATNFQAQMLMVQTQAGASAEEVKRLSGEVLKLASSGAQQGPTMLAQGLFHLESLGLRGADAMQALKVSSDAAAVGMANLEDVTTALGGVVVTGIRGAQDYQQAMGTLNATIGAGNLHMQDLIGFLGTGVVPAAKLAGVSLSELGAALAVMTDRGIGADQAGTRLRMTFALMQAPSHKAVDALKDMGINANQMATMLRGPDGLLKVLQMLHDGMASVGKVQGSRDILGAFGGGRSGAGILTLVQSLDSAVSSYQGKVAQIQATSGNLAANEAAQQKTSAAQFHRDLAQMEADLTKLGGAILPAVTAVVGGVTQIGNAFSDLPGPVKQDLGVIVGLLAVGGPLMLAGVGVAKMVRSIGDTFGLLPLKAGPAVLATDAELATIGTTAVATEAEVAALGVELGALATIGPIAVVVTASLLLTPGLESFMHWAGQGISHSFGAVTGSGVGASGATPKPEDPSKGTPWERASYASQWQMIAMGLPLEGPGATPFKPPSYYMKHPAAEQAIIDAMRGPLPGVGTAAGGIANRNATAGFGGTDQAGTKPLTAAQQFQLALGADPTNLKLLNEKAVKDASTIAWLKKRQAEGKISNAEYVKQVGLLQADQQSTLSQIQSIQDAAKAAATKAAKAAAAFTLPANLTVDAAKAAATVGTADDMKVARETKTFALAMIHSGKLKGQALADAWAAVTGANSSILSADQAATAAAKKRSDAAKAAAAAHLAIIQGQYGIQGQLLGNALAAAQLDVKNIAGQRAIVKSIIGLYAAEFHDMSLPLTDRLAARSNQLAEMQTLQGLKYGSGIVAATFQKYPGLEKYRHLFAFKQSGPNAQGYQSESYAKGQSDSFDKSKLAIELYGSKNKPADLAGEIVSHFLAKQPQGSGPGVDPALSKLYQQFVKTITPQQMAWMRRDYQSEGGVKSRPFAQYERTSGQPALFRGSLFGQLDSGDVTYTKAQHRLFSEVKDLLGKPKPFAVPMRLQLAAAKSGTTVSTADDMKIARETKAYDEKLLKSHRLSLQGQIDVYNNIAQQNQILGNQTLNSHAHAISARHLADLLGLHGEQKKAGEGLLAQVMAHGGHLPRGIAALGQVIPIHTHIYLDGKSIATVVTKHQQKTARRTSASTRNGTAGSGIGLH